MFSLPESFWEDLERGYNQRPIISIQTDKPYVFSLPKMIETLDLFVANELEALDKDIYEVYTYKATATQYKGYSKNTIRGAFKPGNPLRDLIDLLCLYAHGKTYVQCVKDGILPNDLAEFAKLKSLIKGRMVKWPESLDISVPTPSKQGTLQEQLITIVRGANDAEYNAYCQLPEVTTAGIDKFIWPDGIAYKRIFTVLTEHQKKGWIINNTNNPSGHEEYGIWIDRLTDRNAVIKTEEFWYLRWFNVRTGKYIHIYNEVNIQTWCLIKRNEVWKVISTYYPKPRWRITNFFLALWRRFFGE
jgi:hypothetical protein